MTNEFNEWSESLTRQVKRGVAKEIAEHKLRGQPIFYEENNMLIMENPNGEKFEYKLEDGDVQIIRKLNK